MAKMSFPHLFANSLKGHELQLESEYIYKIRERGVQYQIKHIQTDDNTPQLTLKSHCRLKTFFHRVKGLVPQGILWVPGHREIV